MRQLFLVKVIALFIVLMASASVIAGTHFIVLIDDNQDFKRDYIDKIAKTLPEVLFDGIQKKQSVGTAIPIYRPNIDHLSLAFFGLTKSPKSCMKSDPLSLKPEQLFHWGLVPADLYKEKFSKFLERALSNECRFKSFASPIFTAESLILPFVQTKLNRDLFFSRTVLLLLSNDAYDEQSNPNQEIKNLGNEIENSSVVDALDTISLVAKKFRLDRPVDGVFTVPNGETDTFLQGGRLKNKDKLKESHPLVYRMTEFRPIVPKLDEWSDYPKEIKLDRLAVSNQELQIVPVGGDDAAILPIPTVAIMEAIDVSFQFADSEENIWQLGKHEFPQYKLLMVDDCKKDVCIKQADGIHISLFKVITAELSLMPDDDPLEAGTLYFTIKFRYKTNGVYDHVVYDMPWHKIDISPNRPLTTSDLFFSKIHLDNKTLAKEWTTSDTKGLSQEEAKKRIEAYRNFWWGVISFIVLIVVSLLYARYSKHPFKPVLEWKSADEIKLNFNQQTDAHIQIGTLTLKNKGKAKARWLLVRLHLLKKEKLNQPDCSAKLSLSYKEALDESGLCLDDVTVPLGFYQESQLVAELEQKVSHETSIHIFLATKAITDFKPANNKTTFSDPVSLPIEASVKMEWKELLTKKIYAKIGFKIQLIPEDATPQVSYNQRKDKKKCYFDLGKKVWVGTLYFKSGVRHHFAVQFQGKFTVQAYRDNDPISSEAIVIEGGEQTATTMDFSILLLTTTPTFSLLKFLSII